jgi:endonuclease/exonuclease/phosphatase family metal-dependent hydrolase
MPQAIVNSARLLRGWAERTAARLPLIVCGDFNADKNSAAYEMLADGAVLRDAWRAANPPDADATTFHAFGQPGVAAAIDWVLVSPALAVRAATIDRARPAGRYPSDHDPVVAALG